MGREKLPNVGWQKFRPAKGYVAHCGVARGLRLLFPCPIGVQNHQIEIRQLRREHRSHSWGQAVRQLAAEAVKEGFPRLGVVAFGRDGYRRDQRIGRSKGQNDRRGHSRPWGSRRGDSMPGVWSRGAAGPEAKATAGGEKPAGAAVRRRVRVEMRPEDGNMLGGAGVPSGDGVDAPGSVITAESSP